MNLNQLHYFVTVIEKKTLVQAAKDLYITQPALTRSLSKLADEIGVPLFINRGRLIYPTADGESFYACAKSMLASYNQFLAESEKHRLSANNSLTIAISGPQFSRPLLLGFQQAYPEHHLSTVSIKRQDLPGILDSETIGFALTTKADNLAGLENILIARRPLYAILPSAHPLSGRESISLNELRDETFILPPAENMFQVTADYIFAQAGFEPQVLARVQQVTLMRMVADGLGITLGISTALSYDLKAQQKCTAIPLQDHFCTLDIYLCWRPEVQRSQCFDDFLKYIKQHGTAAVLADS